MRAPPSMKNWRRAKFILSFLTCPGWVSVRKSQFVAKKFVKKVEKWAFLVNFSKNLMRSPPRMKNWCRAKFVLSFLPCPGLVSVRKLQLVANKFFKKVEKWAFLVNFSKNLIRATASMKKWGRTKFVLSFLPCPGWVSVRKSQFVAKKFVKKVEKWAFLVNFSKNLMRSPPRMKNWRRSKFVLSFLPCPGWVSVRKSQFVANNLFKKVEKWAFLVNF